MKYRNREDNYYDKETFWHEVAEKSSTNISPVIISKQSVGQANSYLSTYKSCRRCRYILLVTVLVSPYLLILPIVAVLLCVYMEKYSTVNLSYQLTGAQKAAFEEQVAYVKKIMPSQRVSWIKSRSKIFESRYEAGAKEILDGVPCKILYASPYPFRTNLKVLSIQSEQTSVTFFPDRIIIISNDHVADIPYEGLCYEYEDYNFVEDRGVPKDAIIIGYTWAYVNKDGSPDRRFKNNQRLPICGYGKLSITSKHGLNVCLMFSNRNLWDHS